MENERKTVHLCLVIMAVGVTIALVHFGKGILMPVAVASVLRALLAPLNRRLHEAGLPYWASATVLVTVLLGMALLGVLTLWSPVSSWVETIPDTVNKAQEKLIHFRDTNLSFLAPESSSPGQATPPESSQKPLDLAEVAKQSGSVALRIVGGTTRTVQTFTEIVLLLLLLLASGDLFMKKLLKVVHERHREVTGETVKEIEEMIRGYLVVTACLSGGQALVLALALWALGMPSPLFWAVGCFVLEFIPYLGATVMIVLLLASALTTFSTVLGILSPALVYLGLSTLQNNVASPIAYGKKLQLNPVSILIGVLFWLALWGTPGAFIAVPLVACMRIIADKSSSLRPVSEFLKE